MDWIIKSRYHIWAMSSFVVLAALGVLLRLMHVIYIPYLNYQFILHAHSHFAFAGWTFLGMAILIAGRLSAPQRQRQFKNTFNFTLFSAYGMLVCFSLQGYKALSIAFSTLFIFATYYFTRQVIKSLNEKPSVSGHAKILLKGALFYLCFSSLGPFALGPAMALGLKGGSVYQDIIYFYLHFQMNGWMQLAAFFLIETAYFQPASYSGSGRAAQLLVWSTLPLYFVFTLWSSPPAWIYLLATVGAAAHLFSWIVLLTQRKHWLRQLPLLIKMALLAIIFKAVLQLLVCIPQVGTWVFSQRNIIIGYIHLLTLGIILPVLIDQFRHMGLFNSSKKLRITNVCFIVAVISYLALLFAEPGLKLFNVFIGSAEYYLLALSLLLMLISTSYFFMLTPGRAADKKSDRA